jgi:hypothetical protein
MYIFSATSEVKSHREVLIPRRPKTAVIQLCIDPVSVHQASQPMSLFEPQYSSRSKSNDRGQAPSNFRVFFARHLNPTRKVHCLVLDILVITVARGSGSFVQASKRKIHHNRERT